MSDASAPRIVIDKGTLVPLGVVLSVVGTLTTMGIWMSSRFTAIDMAIGNIDRRIAFLESSRFDRWTGTDMRIWEAVMAKQNPTLTLPGVGSVIAARPEDRPK